MIFKIGGVNVKAVLDFDLNTLCKVDLSRLFFNRPCVARAVLQTPLSLINKVTQSSCVEISSNHCLSQTVGAIELKV